jgi:branched-subunit amino acid aminotransferase/4-amino-4-deoxychorismate lyase
MQCYIDGQWQRGQSARIPADDTGFQLGLGIFTTAAITSRVPLFMSAHLQRLSGDARALGFRAPTAKDIRSVVCDGIDRNRLANGVVKIIVTAGRVNRNRSRSALYVFLEPPRPSPGIVRLLLLETTPTRWSAHKTLARAELVMLRHRATRARCFDALMLDQNDVLETTIANLFLLRRGTVITPRADGRILPGIARQRLVADRDLCIREQRVRIKDIENCEGMFVTNCVRGIMPVSTVKGPDGTILWRSGESQTWIETIRQAWMRIIAAEIPPRS